MDKNLNKHYLDVFSTVEPLNHVLRTFGLSCVSRYQGKIRYSWYNSKIILILSILFIANGCNIYVKIEYALSPRVVNFSNSIQLFYLLGYFQYIIDIYFIRMYRKDYLEYYSLYDYIDRVLGMPHYIEIRRNILKMSLFFIFIVAITIIVDCIAWIFSAGWFLTFIYSIDYLYVGLRLICAMDVISHYTQVLFRLKVITNSLKAFYSDNGLKLGGLVAAWKNNDRLDKLKIVCSSHCDVILWFRRCYLLLLEQCDFVNTVYGFRVLVNNLIFLMDMVILLNLLIRQMTGTIVTNYDSGHLPIVSTMMRITTSLCLILFGVGRCEQSYRETKRIISSIDDIIINKKTAHEDCESLMELKHLITTRPVKFTAVNFYRIDYSCFVSVSSVIVTYTIILLQSLK